MPATALQHGGTQATWTVDGAPIAIGRHFMLQVVVCPSDAELVRVDATMPAHRHGMNYRPGIQALGGGRWRVEGMMFHMPGEWELRLDVRSGDRTVSLRQTVRLP